MMKESKKILKNITGKIDSFTPPFGYFESDFIKIAKEVGYNKIYINNYLCFWIQTWTA